MKTAELKSFGMEGLVWTERDVPKPGPGEVLVRMRGVLAQLPRPDVGARTV